MNWKNGVLLSGILLLSGCAAPTVRYYSLAAPASARAETSAPAERAHASYGLRLRVVQVPASVDRAQLVVQDPASRPSVQVLNESLWVASLRDQIQMRLADEVATQLGVPDLSRLPEAAHAPVRNIVVQVTRFDLVWGQGAWLDAAWTDRGPGARAVRVCQASLSVPAGASVSSLVQAQQQLLGRLAELIAHRGTQPASGGPLLQSSGCTL
ncbi:hypothetical protein CDEF62S_05581 [Castellaniella defragrans]